MLACTSVRRLCGMQVSQTQTDKNKKNGIMPVQSFKQTYDEILELYDFAEALVETVEDNRIIDPYAQQKLVIDLVDSLEQAGDELSGELLTYVQSEGNSHKVHKTKIESAFRKVFNAIDKYRKQVQDVGRNIADEIVARVEQHVEHVVAVFLDFVRLGVNRFMHHQQIEDMKRRERHVASILHEMGLGHA